MIFVNNCNLEKDICKQTNKQTINSEISCETKYSKIKLEAKWSWLLQRAITEREKKSKLNIILKFANQLCIYAEILMVGPNFRLNQFKMYANAKSF